MAFMPTTAPASSPVLYGFTGREFDAESRIGYHRARMYDFVTGKWLSQDPIGEESGDQNFYRYVKNRPVVGRDPLGLKQVNEGGGYDGFTTRAEAAKHVLSKMNPISRSSKREITANIYFDKQRGTYFVSEIEALGERGGTPKMEKLRYFELVGGLHTHGSVKAGGGRGEGFSEDDINQSHYWNVPEYMITPTDRVLVYDPSDGVVGEQE